MWLALPPRNRSASRPAAKSLGNGRKEGPFPMHFPQMMPRIAWPGQNYLLRGVKRRCRTDGPGRRYAKGTSRLEETARPRQFRSAEKECPLDKLLARTKPEWRTIANPAGCQKRKEKESTAANRQPFPSAESFISGKGDPAHMALLRILRIPCLSRIAKNKGTVIDNSPASFDHGHPPGLTM